jgi:hypothetical protein
MINRKLMVFSAPEGFEEYIAAAVERAVLAERARGEQILTGLVAELLKMVDARLARVMERAEQIGADLRELNASRADARGILRRQTYTPH